VTSQTHPPCDAVELEIFKHLFAAVAEEMGARLMRSAYSPNIKERRDFSCALFDSDGEMLAQAEHIPVHLGAAPASVQAVLEAFNPASMQENDRFILNDPFTGGTHLPDITVLAPCVLPGEAAPRFLVANRAHHADIGGSTPGSMPISTSIDEEGLRIPPTKLGKDTVEWVCAHSRTPEERRGDLQAQLAALQVGVFRMHELCQRYGAELVSRRGNELAEYTERIIRRTIAAIPDGKYSFEDVLDDDGHGALDIAIRCKLTVAGDSAVVDFTASGDQVRGPVNAVSAITSSAVNYVFRCLAPADIPSNVGIMRPVTVITRPGSVLDALPPAAVAGGNVETSQRIVDVLLGALAQALPDRIPSASSGTMNNLSIGGIDPCHGAAYAYYETIGGGAGAGPALDGASGVHTHMTNTRNTPVEALEHAYPIRVEAYSIRRGSGGAGKYRGGDGIVRRFAFSEKAEVTLLADRRRHSPYGLRNGGPGAPGADTLIHPDGTRRPLPGKCNITIEPGQELEIAAPGGGGWGDAESEPS